jgi:hypothetical protein
MNLSMPALTLGVLIALVVLVVAIVFLVVGGASTNILLGLIAALAVARLT